MSIKQNFSHPLLSILLLVFSMAMMACVSQTPTPQYPGNISVALLNIHDDNANLASTAIPDDIEQSLIKPITDRNLSVKSIAFDAVQSEMTRIRDTSRRSQVLAQTAENSQILLINEIQTEFYSVLSGRYRWNVQVKLSIFDLATGDTLSDDFTIPAVLMYAHEKGDDAILSVIGDIQRHIGSLIDRFLAGRALPKAPSTSSASLSSEGEAPKSQDALSSEGGSPGIASIGAPPGKFSTPHPIHGQAIYFILIDRFFNALNSPTKNLSDPLAWHGGNLQGIREKLSYIKDMGFTAIWISPVFLTAKENFFGNAAFHGYWTYDLSQIDPQFGTESDLVALATAAQESGISLILDFVVNHVGYGSPLVEEKPDWFHAPLTIEDWNDPKQLVERQVHGLPDLDQSNPEVYQYIYHAAQKWLSIPNISGLRLDAVKHVSMDFWKTFNSSLRATHPNITLLGEYFDGDPQKVDAVQKEGGFTHLFDFPLAFALRDVFCENKSLGNLVSTIANDRQYSHPNNMVTFIDNHDMPRFISLCKNDENAMARALTVLLSWRGIPSIYYGTETPLKGSKEPDNRADMDFGHAAFHDLIKTALQWRNQHPVLSLGSTHVYDYQKDFAVIYRYDENENSLIVISQKSTPTPYRLPNGAWMRLGDKHSYRDEITVAPKSVSIYIQTSDKPLIHNKEVTVTFELPKDGATYAIAGSTPQLGSWNPQKAPKAKGGSLDITLPANTVVLYKLVKVKKNTTFQWSKRENSELFISGKETTQSVKTEF